MPNNCYGKLIITANDDRIKEIKTQLRGTWDSDGNPFDFNKVIPMPEDIYRGSLGIKEKELYGKNNWNDWSIENWGTKKNSCDTEELDDGFAFWTAWSPCSPVIEELAKKFPDASFNYSYYEPNMCFCGKERYENGKLVYIMEADISERWKDDDLPNDPEYGREEEKITCLEETPGYKVGTILKSIDDVEYRTLVDGMFCEGTDNALREKLYAAMDKRKKTVRKQGAE